MPREHDGLSILLTPFGRDFCELALPTDMAEFASLSGEPATASATDPQI